MADEWYTPKWIFDDMGIHFDLDVAHPDCKTNVPATKVYTKEDDGLNKPWFGNVWMNPPFSNTSPWAYKFLEHKNGIALVPMSKSKWFGKVWKEADAISYLHTPNLRWELPDGNKYNMSFPIVLFAFGQKNIDAISKVGHIR
jgi:phage N-6-adenine-methyltransferase